MSITKHVAQTALAAAALGAPLAIADAALGTAPWQHSQADAAPCTPWCGECADAAALAAQADADALAAQADADYAALMALTDDEIAALDAALPDDDDDAAVNAVRFDDGLGWDWPGTPWDVVAPF